MILQSSNAMLAGEAFSSIRVNQNSWKAQAQNAQVVMQTGPVGAQFIFSMLDQLSGLIAAINLWKVVAGLDAYANGQGYVGTMSTDVAACGTAALACINWVVANFPNAGGFLQSETLNADGSRTQRNFTSAQTLGLQTALQAFIATIG